MLKKLLRRPAFFSIGFEAAKQKVFEIWDLCNSLNDCATSNFQRIFQLRDQLQCLNKHGLTTSDHHFHEKLPVLQLSTDKAFSQT